MFNKIKFSDWALLLEWRNHPKVRNSSINTGIIDEETHQKYITNLIERKDRTQYIFEYKGNYIGYVREDINKDGNELSYLINPKEHGKGYGTLMMKEFLNTRNGKFFLHIKKDNIASIKMAEKNGFVKKQLVNNTYKLELYKMTDLEIINKVEQIRKGNNVNWMDLVRLAFEIAPDRARPIFKKINESDGEISKLLDQLANNG
jgi:RimJ/RimL family protein N-acetyltransferase